jgi:hypothetical protein
MGYAMISRKIWIRFYRSSRDAEIFDGGAG